jgi:PKD repeat protein
LNTCATLQRLTSLALIAGLLTACGGGGGGNPPAQNLAPTAGFTLGLPLGGAPVQVKFFNQSSDPDGTLVNFEWDFDGDGTFDQSGGEPDGLFLYQQPGTFQVTLRVTDNGGLTANATNQLVIPEAVISSTLVDAAGTDEPTSFSGLQVDGNPAVFYSSQGKLLYSRASDSAGTNWGDPLAVAPLAASFTSAASVGGNPAVLFHSTGNLHYVRATDALGEAWGDVETLNVVSFEGPAPVALLVVEGQPAALFEGIIGGAPNRVFYQRSSDALGNTWDPGLTVGLSPSGVSLEDMDGLLVDGRPAFVCVSATGELLYMRAEDSLGAAWPSTPLEVAPGLTLTRPSAAIIAGRPAIAATGNNSLFFLQADDAAGTSWQAPQTVVSAPGSLTDASLANVAGRTVIAFRIDATDALDVVIAANADGNDFQTRKTIAELNALGHFTLPQGAAPGVVYNLDGAGVQFGRAE